MQPISDKELDRMFREGFEDTEFQPSDAVWERIISEIDATPGKARRSFPVFWTAAASVVFLLGAALWLYRPVEVIRLQGNNVIAETTDEPKGRAAYESASERPLPDAVPEDKQTSFVSRRPAPAVLRVMDVSHEVETTREAEVSHSIEVIPIRVNIPDEVSSREEVILASEYSTVQSQLNTGGEAMLAKAEIPAEEMVAGTEPASSKRINSIGSLVNFVVAHVDRREDKIIEFSDGEEGSQISGLNLGLVKLKNRNKY